MLWGVASLLHRGVVAGRPPVTRHRPMCDRLVLRDGRVIRSPADLARLVPPEHWLWRPDLDWGAADMAALTCLCPIDLPATFAPFDMTVRRDTAGCWREVEPAGA